MRDHRKTRCDVRRSRKTITARNECGRNAGDMDLERNRFARERASFVYLHTHTRSKGAAVTRKANQRPAEWPQRGEEDRKREREKARESEREAASA